MALQRLLSAATLLWLALLYLSLGELLLKVLRVRFEKPLLRMLVRMALGFGLVGNALMVLCFLHRATPVAITLLLITFSALGSAAVRTVWSDGRAMVDYLCKLIPQAPKFSLLLLMVVASAYAALSLLPPASFDALMYHLAVPRLILERHGFWDIYFNEQSDFPMLTEMHFLIGLAWGNDLICNSVVLLLGAAACGAALQVSRTLLKASLPAQLLTLLIILTSTNAIANLAQCNVDFAQALWMLLAIVVLQQALRPNLSLPHLVVASLLAGMAMQSKVFGLFILPVLVASLLLMRRKSLFNRQTLVALTALLLPALLLASPWYIKSMLYKQTILTPYGARHISSHLTQFSPLTIVGGWIADYATRLLTTPWSFTLFPSLHRFDTFGPLPLAILPFMLLCGIPPQSRLLLGASTLYFLELLLLETLFQPIGVSIRYSTMPLLIAAALIPVVVERMGRFVKSQMMVKGMVMVVLLSGTALLLKRYHQEWHALLTNQSRDEFYAHLLPEYPALQCINALPQGAVIMPVYNFSNYLIKKPYIAASRRLHSPKGAEQELQRNGITHIFLNNTLDPAENNGDYLKLPLQQIFERNGFSVHRLLLPPQGQTDAAP
jgi:hypothetical protein